MSIGSYEQFVTFLFDRPCRDGCVKWFFEEDFLGMDVGAHDFVVYASGVFRNIKGLADVYSEAQICLGLEYMVDRSCGLLCFNFLSSDVGLEERVFAVSSMYEVFEKLFDERCSGVGTHSELAPAISYDRLCYMWWDVFPRHGIPRSAELQPIDDAILLTLRRILTLKNPACKESALHGLGHWCLEYPDEVAQIIRGPNISIPPQLAAYSSKAMRGDVQ